MMLRDIPPQGARPARPRRRPETEPETPKGASPAMETGKPERLIIPGSGRYMEPLRTQIAAAKRHRESEGDKWSHGNKKFECIDSDENLRITYEDGTTYCYDDKGRWFWPYTNF